MLSTSFSLEELEQLNALPRIAKDTAYSLEEERTYWCRAYVQDTHGTIFNRCIPRGCEVWAHTEPCPDGTWRLHYIHEEARVPLIPLAICRTPEESAEIEAWLDACHAHELAATR